MATLKGMYAHPDQVTIGNQTSENKFLVWCKKSGVNMLNNYARSFLYTSTKRTQLAAFIKKAKESYGIILATVDARFRTKDDEHDGWLAYLDKYAGTVSVVEPLTEKEPWVLNGTHGYDYPGAFFLLETLGKICKDRRVDMNFYEGWMGSKYMPTQEVRDAYARYEAAKKIVDDKIAAGKTPTTAEKTAVKVSEAEYNTLQAPYAQEAVDKMVQHCRRVFISRYNSMSDYNSTSPSLGKWDNRMDKRCATIAIAAPKFNKVQEILYIDSLERKIWGAANDFLGELYLSHSFYGSVYTAAEAAYNLSPAATLQNTDLVGNTIFYSKYAMLARP